MNPHLYGVTHSLDGKPIVIEPRTTKVGIGLPKGKSVHVAIDQGGKWVVLVGKEAKRFDTKAGARKCFGQVRESAPDRKYPQRLPYFCFSHIGRDGTFEPDWEATESHGPLPTEIDIIFVRDDPFQASYQMWTATEKKCEGDGVNALRVLSMAQTPKEKDLAAQAERSGAKYFAIRSGCWMHNCPFSKSADDKRSACRPHGRLVFQLLNAPRLGGTAYFDTTGFRSISQLFSCIQTFKAVTGQGDPGRGFVAGIPLKLILRPYRTSHNGQAATQYGVSLEFRAESALDLKRRLIEHGVQFRLADSEPLRLLQSEPSVVVSADDDLETVPESPAAIAAEFTTGQDDGMDDLAGPDIPDAGARAPDASPAGDVPTDDFNDLWPGQEPAPTAPTPVQPPAVQTQEKPREESERWKKLYSACRVKGMTDAVIMAELGSLGCESPADLTEQTYKQFWGWARAWKAEGLF